ncbi:unnamed protein product, partial [Discosporangium mesarthrocarpum]
MATILCIEDEDMIRQDIVEELTDAGHDVMQACDGAEGLRLLLSKMPDLVLCDISMPVMDGHTLLTELRESYPEHDDLPFVFLSALADRDDVIAGKKLGADDYLTKPIDFEMLHATVESRLRQVGRMSERKQDQMILRTRGNPIMARILCIEDEKFIREDIVEELEDAGHEVVQADCGADGLEAIRAGNLDLVLCDISMPVMDGHALLTELRTKHPEFDDLPFVFLSALGDRKDVIAGKQLGADDYLTKPIDFEMLHATIDSRLRQVDRMAERKDLQMVKLYKALSEVGESPSE